MSKMSMPFGGRTITTSVSGGGASGLVVLIAALVALLVAGHAAAAFFEQYAETIRTWLTVLVIAAVVGLASPLLWMLLVEVVTWPHERRAESRFREHAAEVRRAIEARAAAATDAAAYLEAEPIEPSKLAPIRSTDDTRDGRLIDATGRFRSLGTFLPVDDREVVDAEVVDSTTVDREA